MIFSLLFGGFWLFVTTLIAVPFYIAGLPNQPNMWWLHLFFLLFYVIGFSFFIFGIKKLIKNILTSKKGERCIGIVESINSTNTYVNNAPVLEAKIVFFKESTNEVLNGKETIGLDMNKYPVNSFVYVKQYNDDINIIGPCDKKIVNSTLKERLGYIENKNEDYGVSYDTIYNYDKNDTW